MINVEKVLPKQTEKIVKKTIPVIRTV